MKTTDRIGVISASVLTAAYGRMSEFQKVSIRRRRLLQIVHYAKARSPLFSELFAGLGDDFELGDLPVTTKTGLMERFDDWVTDGAVSLDGLREFMNDPDNNGRLFLHKYLVFKTSGTTGPPMVFLYDKSMINVLNAVALERGFPTARERSAFFLRRCKAAVVCSSVGFNISSGMLRFGQSVNPVKRYGMELFDVFAPLPEVTERLNRFRPAMLGGYPSSLCTLAQEQIAGRLNISPLIVLAGGEYLSEDSIKTLQAAFGRRPVNSYASTESGTIANECACGHMHINDDWIVMEPVDSENKPVAAGRLADKWLLTNLCSFTQPIIRYEVTDRIIYHDEGCPCGRKSPWVEVEGRASDMLRFRGEDGEIEFAPLFLDNIISNITGVKIFQAILHDGDRLELRLVADGGAPVFENVKAAVDAFLSKNGIHVSIYLSDDPPGPDKSGKFIHVRNAPENEPPQARV
ncbi:MAG: phenylacetate--CoA ligase family protein [Clostridiales bacterium]|nr:phenylacetate--CoA ligase family protein [Clostridiales bacterium]